MDTSGRIAQLGCALGPDVLTAVRALYNDQQQALAAAHPAIATDLAYGDHPRHRLDLYAPADVPGAPVLVFVHGGGFVKGDKGGGSPEAWPNANVGRMAKANGMVGVVINYRLAPDDMWPAGAEDLAAALVWVKSNVAAYGGDPDRIVLVGTSAGAVHVAGWLKLVGEADALATVRGAVLLSGLYGYTPLDPRDELYYGAPALYPDRMPRDAIAATALPLLVACAHFDPPRFQAEFLAMLQDRLARHGAMPAALIQGGHNHYSMTMHLGTADRRLSDAIRAFVRDTTR